MGIKDLFITPIYFILFSIIAYWIRPFVTTRETRKYFIPSLFVRFGGAILSGIIYQYYYSWGDTYSYFRDARLIYEYFITDPVNGLRIIFFSESSVFDLHSITNRLWYFGALPEFSTVKIVSFFSLFTFHTYSATALIFAIFSFSGNWAFYSVLVEKFPGLGRKLGIYTLFIPSVIFWGSGIFKDTITYGSLLWMFYGLFNWIEFRRRKPFYLIIIILGFVPIFFIKKYILICFVGTVIFWILYRLFARIKSRVFRFLLAPFILVISIGGSVWGAFLVGEEDRKYSIDNIAKTAMVTAYDIRYGSGKDAGSGFTLGVLDGTWQSMLILAPQAINVSLFRPYIWEVRNPLMLLSSLEGLIILVLTILTFSKRYAWVQLFKNPLIVFMLLFALLFAFAVGVSSFNFGTLSRYKIPFMPFYLGAIAILRYKK